MARGTFRINYYVKGQPVSAFVTADSEQAAADFLGIRDGSASFARVAYPVEVVGLDKAHDSLPAIPVIVPPPAPPPGLSPAEVEKLRGLIGEHK